MNKKFLLLQDELKLMNGAASVLEYSYKKCKRTRTKKRYTIEEQDTFENLTSRFARLSDIIIQRIFKTIHSLDLDDINTVRDSINLAEKKNLIKSAKEMIEIRELRNSIVHEYIPDVIRAIYIKTKKITPSLLENVRLINSYCKNSYKSSDIL
jgi:hypothetical protein